MATRRARKVPQELADKFEELVADGAHAPSSPLGPPRPPQMATEPEDGRAEASDRTAAAVRQVFDDLREDVRQGLAAAAQVQFDALAPVKTALDRLIEEMSRDRESVDDSGVPSEALRDEMRHLASQLTAVSAVNVPPEMGALRAELELMSEELQRDRGHRDALRASVLDAVGSSRQETQDVGALLERVAKEAESREADAKAMIAGLRDVREALVDLRGQEERERSAAGGVHLEVMRAIEAFRRDLGDQLRVRGTSEADIETLVARLDAGLNGVRDVVDEVRAEDERAREAAAGAGHDLMRTLEAFHDELVEQWRERTRFEASVPPLLDGIRVAVNDGVAKLSAGIGFLPAVVEEMRLDAEPIAAELIPSESGHEPAEPGPDPNEKVLREVAALRGELADRSGQLDEFLRTAVTGANRWFVKLRDDLYQRMDDFAQASTNAQEAGGEGGGGTAGSGQEAVVSAIEVLRADVLELHTYLAMVDSNLQRFHDSVLESATPEAVRKAAAKPGTPPGPG